MSLALLGPIEILGDDGGAATPLGARQVRLVAALAVNAGVAVDADRLVDMVWDEHDMPANGVGTLRTNVSRLRRLLPAEVELATQGSSYRLLTNGAFDVDQFEELIAAGREALENGELTEAIGHLDGALVLWRGTPYSEVADLDWAQPEVVRLDELRASAVELRFEALLSKGRHTEVVGPIEDAIVRAPWRDRLRGQLILALYRAGRQVEALQAYEEYRRELVDELGLTPSSELQDLERRILDQDPTLIPPSHQARRLRGYELDEVIGEGSYAMVWRGTQPVLGRDVAVKQMRAKLANSPQFIRHFEAEAHMVASLEHPYIVPLYDFWREPDAAFLVMRYLRGGTLESRLVERPLRDGELRRLVDQVGSALDLAHRRGVIHRDVKPGNVLLDDEANFYLGDFGIAFDLETTADDVAALSTGSPGYASPEQLRRQDVDARADVYAFGVTLFEAATGRLPFAEETSHAGLVRRQLEGTIPVPSQTHPVAPGWLDAVVARATAKNPADRYSSVAELVAAIPGLSTVEADGEVRAGRTEAGLRGEVRNPFKGLRAFVEADADDFRGRERLTARFVDVFSQPGSTGRLLAVVGPSGSGKSSAVRAGLLPVLRAGAAPGSDQWFITTMMPGSAPFEELEAALMRVAPASPGPLAEMMAHDRRGIGRATKQVLADESSELLLVIDQFEELFTLVDDDTTRRDFIDGILAALREPRSRLRIVITIRADFWDRPLGHPGLAAMLETGAVSVAPLDPDELESAIVDPVTAAGVEYEPGLIARISADVADQPGALPLLQYTLTQLFDTNVSGLMTTAAYEAMGGITGALAQRAEQLYQQLDDAEQVTARRLFGSLIALGEGTEDTRRRVPASELGTSVATSPCVAQFGDARLLAFDRDPFGRGPTVEIAHEALINAWPRLKGWIDTDRDTLRVHRHISVAATDWDRTNRDPDELYRGARLQAAAELNTGNVADLNDLERTYLTESQQAADADAAHTRRRTRILQSLLATAAVLLVVALVAGFLAVRQRNEAADQRDLAREEAQRADVRRLISESQDQLGVDDARALLMAVEAHDIDDSPATLGALQRVLVGLPPGWLGRLEGRGDYTDARFLPNSTLLIAKGAGGFDVFDVETRQLVHEEEFGGPGGAIAVSNDGALVAAGGDDGTVQILSTVTWGVVDDIRQGGEPIVRAAFSPDGRRLAAALQGGQLIVSDIENGREWELDGIDGTAAALGFDPTGDYLVVAGGERSVARQFHVETGERRGADMQVNDMADGSGVDSAIVAGYVGDRLFVGSGQLLEFDPDTGTPIGERIPLSGLGVLLAGTMTAVNERTVLVIGNGGRVDWVDIETHEVTPLFQDLAAGAPSGDVNEHATLIAVAGSDAVGLWSAAGHRVLGTSIAWSGVQSVVIAESGSWVITTANTEGPSAAWRFGSGELERIESFDGTSAFAYGSGDEAILLRPGPGSNELLPQWIWSLAGEAPGPQPRGRSIAHTLSPGERYVVHPLRLEGVVDVYDRETNQLVVSLDDLLRNAPAGLDERALWLIDAEFDPDGERLFATMGAGIVAIWDTETWALQDLIAEEAGFFAIAFTPDGERAVTLGANGLALRDAEDLSIIAGPVPAGQGGLAGGRFVGISDDGRVIMTSQFAGGTLLWDAETLTPIGDPFPHESLGWGAQLAPAADLLVTIAAEGEAVVWNVDTDSWPETACRAAGRNMTQAEWAQFGPQGQPYRTTCPQYPPGR